MRLISLTILLLLTVPLFAQWKSYYPKDKTKQHKQTKNEEEKEKKKFDFYFFQAIKEKSLDNSQEALKYFQKCIDIDDTKSSPFHESAKINFTEGNYQVSLDQIEKALELEPQNRWYLLLYAELLFFQKDFSKSSIQYKKLINIEPLNHELYFKLSESYIYDKKLKKAIAVYNDLEIHTGIDRMLSIQKHNLYRELNDIQGAIEEIKKIINLLPEDIELMEILAELYLLNDEKEKSFDIFKNIALLKPENGRIHLTLADYYREKGENKKSYEELKLAFKSTELNIDTKVRILISYYKLIGVDVEITKQAYELSEILLSIHPEEMKARAVFADILYTDNKFEEAKQEYLKILEKDKSKNQLWGQVLFIQAEQNDFSGLLKTSSEALEYFPLDPLFYYFNGISNKWFKNYEEAIISLELGIEFLIDNNKLLVEFYSSLADIYHITDQHKISDKYYQKVLEIDSNNIIVLNNYAYYLALRSVNLEKAKKMSYKCNELEVNNGTYQDTYAWVLYKMEKYERAKKWILKALSNGGEESPVVIEHYGDILYRLGEKKEAINNWKKAKKLGEGSQLLNKKIKEGILYE